MPHSENCRKRIEKQMAEKGDNMRQRFEERKTRREENTKGKKKREDEHIEGQKAERQRIRRVADQADDDITLAEFMKRGQMRALEEEERGETSEDRKRVNVQEEP